MLDYGDLKDQLWESIELRIFAIRRYYVDLLSQLSSQVPGGPGYSFST